MDCVIYYIFNVCPDYPQPSLETNSNDRPRIARKTIFAPRCGLVLGVQTQLRCHHRLWVQKLFIGRTGGIGQNIFYKTNWDSRLCKNVVACPIPLTICPIYSMVPGSVNMLSYFIGQIIFCRTNWDLGLRNFFLNLSNQLDNLSNLSYDLAIWDMVPASVNMLPYFIRQLTFSWTN